MPQPRAWLERIRADLWYRPDANFAALDGLRGFASVIVVLYHCALFTGMLSPRARAEHRLGWLEPLVNGCWSGIDIFFVLSGFLIGRILMLDLREAGRVRYRRFLIRRACRIFPAYYLALGLSVAVAAFLEFRLFVFLYGSQDRRAILENSWANFLYLNNYLIPRNSGDVFSWGWSLCVEEHFYLLLPPLLWLIFGRLRPRYRFAALALCTLAPFLGRALQYLRDPALEILDGFYYYSHNRFDAIFLGVCLAYLYVHHPEALARVTRRLGHGAWILGLALVASVWVFGGLFVQGAFAVVWQFALMALGAGLFLLNGLFQRNAASRFFASPLWYPLARISYGTYLIHPFVLFAALELAGFGSSLHVLGAAELLALFAVVFGVSSLLAAGLFVGLESRWLRRGQRWARRYA